MIHQHGFPRTDQWGCYKKGCNSLHKEDWNKTMSDYITGFGKPPNKEEYPSDFWIGLNAMNVLTNKNMEARIELIDWDQKRYGILKKLEMSEFKAICKLWKIQNWRAKRRI